MVQIDFYHQRTEKLDHAAQVSTKLRPDGTKGNVKAELSLGIPYQSKIEVHILHDIQEILLHARLLMIDPLKLDSKVDIRYYLGKPEVQIPNIGGMIALEDFPQFLEDSTIPEKDIFLSFTWEGKPSTFLKFSWKDITAEDYQITANSYKPNRKKGER